MAALLSIVVVPEHPGVAAAAALRAVDDQRSRLQAYVVLCPLEAAGYAPVRRQDLDMMRCGRDGCTSEHGPLVFHSRCHPRAPTWTAYLDGELAVQCADCGAELIRIAIGDTPP